jgi:hypothetical protein
MVRFVTVSIVALLTSALSLAPAAAQDHQRASIPGEVLTRDRSYLALGKLLGQAGRTPVKQVDAALLAARGGHPEPLLHA